MAANEWSDNELELISELLVEYIEHKAQHAYDIRLATTVLEKIEELLDGP
jgi:hypothetical protein